ncbi:MAG TPA: thiamine-phosphate kinase [Myxococcota bacterium]|nr:thiamine-phosphate kinase [Myxococcota bacterium]
MSPPLSSLGEFGLVALFERAAQARHPATRVGIGDDCAVLDLGGLERVLLTTDLLLERVHFEAAWLSAEDLGHKSMAVNLSDVAAMGGEAVAALLALGLPPGLEVAWVEGLRDGLVGCARAYGLELVGGDTVSAPGGAVVCLTVLGRAPADEVVLRSGGQPGDRVLATGPLGDSAAGLHLLRGGGAGLAPEDRAALLLAHRRPEPQLALGRELARRRLAHAMIDVSDGLVQDLGHICERSGLGAELDADGLPLSAAARRLDSTT